MKREKLMVAAIENGTVIDHIPSEKLFAVIRLLHIEELDHDTVFIGYNLHSHLMQRKSIIKIANRFFSPAELNRLSVVAPNVTLSIHGEWRRAALPLLRNGAADRYGEVGVTSVGLYNRTPSTNLADSAFPCASVGFEKTDTRGGKLWLSAPALFRAAESFSSTGNDGRRSGVRATRLFQST